MLTKEQKLERIRKAALKRKPRKDKKHLAGRRTSFDAAKKKHFLETLLEVGVLTTAAKMIGVNHGTIYVHMEKDPMFKQLVDEVMEQSIDDMEAEAIRRGVRGVKEPVWYQGKIVGYQYRPSDKMLEMVLKAKRPEQYNPRQNITLSGDENNPIVISQTKGRLLEMLGVKEEDITDVE